MNSLDQFQPYVAAKRETLKEFRARVFENKRPCSKGEVVRGAETCLQNAEKLKALAESSIENGTLDSNLDLIKYLIKVVARDAYCVHSWAQDLPDES